MGKNLPIALAVARSAADPDDPVSVVGPSTPDFVVDAFETSYGRSQQVASVTRRVRKNVRMHYVVNGARPKTIAVREWRGGERYGDTHDDYYAELRVTVTGTKPGDRVEVWFTGNKPRAEVVASEHFTYRVHNDIGGDVLVLALEDVTGSNGSYVYHPDAPPECTDLYSGQADESYKRLTVDLTGANSGELRFFTSYEIEQNWDFGARGGQRRLDDPAGRQRQDQHGHRGQLW